jgi:pyruvate dehydrogenase E2 component (dihydrolipoamide acetyltransferase)
VGALIGVIAEPGVSDADIAGFIDGFVAAVVSFDSDEVPAPAAEAAAKPAAEPPKAAAEPAKAAAEPAKAAAAPATAAALGGTSGETGAASDEARVSPIARRVAERLGVDLSQVIGTGRNGRISKEDVETFAAAATSTANVPVAANPVRRVRMSARRGTIARRLLESKQSIPHYRLDMDVDLGRLLLHKRAQPDSNGKITVNDLLLRAAALALVQHPMVNAQLDGDEILQFENADIAIAVAAEAGLVTPILRNANLKPVSVIAAESRDLIDRARRGSLLRDEISGGSFTISNLGMFGVTRFDAIINAPQVAILAVGATSQRPVVRAGELAVAEVVTLTLSADHRVVDGAVGAAFLSTLRGLLEKPESL